MLKDMGQRHVLSPKLAILYTLGNYAMRFAEALVWLRETFTLALPPGFVPQMGNLKEIRI
jgi:hypothetical protein